MEAILVRENSKGRFTPCCTSQGQSVGRTTRGAKAESRDVGSLEGPSWGKSWGSAAGVRDVGPPFSASGLLQCPASESFLLLSPHTVWLCPVSCHMLCRSLLPLHIVLMPQLHALVMGYSLTLPLLNINYYGTT